MNSLLLFLLVACAAGVAEAKWPAENRTRPTEIALDCSKVVLYSRERNVTWRGVPAACERCDPQPLAETVKGGNATAVVDCHWGPFKLFALDSENVTLASVSLDCGDKGSYRVVYAMALLAVIEDVEPLDSTPAIAGIFGGLYAALVLYAVGCKAWAGARKWYEKRRIYEMEMKQQQAHEQQAGAVELVVVANLSASSSVTSSPQTVEAKPGVPKEFVAEVAKAKEEIEQTTTAAAAEAAVAALKADFASKGATTTQCPKKERVAAVDVFRGITICFMVFVNYGGGGLVDMKHSAWDGLSLADVIFPWFIFAMGASVPFGCKQSIAGATPIKRKDVIPTLRHVGWRALKMIVIGLFLNHFSRIPGVMQRLGVCYFFTTVLAVFSPKILVPKPADLADSASPRDTRIVQAKRAMRDVLPYAFEFAVIAALVLLHEMVTAFVAAPGCPRGYIGPGGIGDHGLYPNCTGGIAGYIDAKVFRTMEFRDPTAQPLYRTGPFDPEGLLSCLNSLLTSFLGLQAGRILIQFNCAKSRCIRWFAWSVVTSVAGAALHFSGAIPMNKNLWSLSYALVLAGLGFAMLAVAYLVVDVWHLWDGNPFRIAGMNSIAIYILHEVFEEYPPFSFEWAQSNHDYYLATNILGVAVCVVFSIVLYRKKVFLKL